MRWCSSRLERKTQTHNKHFPTINNLRTVPKEKNRARERENKAAIICYDMQTRHILEVDIEHLNYSRRMSFFLIAIMDCNVFQNAKWSLGVKCVI